MHRNIVTREQWLEARRSLLAKEREATHQRDRVNAARRALPWVRVEQAYVFEGPDGSRTLAELFDGRSQLFIQHFMLAPEGDHVCEGCALMADGVDAARRHFEHADLSFAAVSRAPVERIEQVRRRMGWSFAWVSSGANSFNRDFGVTVAEDDGESDGYNFGTTAYTGRDLPGISVFARDEAGAVFHTYSAYSRGLETLVSPFNFLDLVPKGRNEQGTMSWVRLHDEYEPASHAAE